MRQRAPHLSRGACLRTILTAMFPEGHAQAHVAQRQAAHRVEHGRVRKGARRGRTVRCARAVRVLCGQ